MRIKNKNVRIAILSFMTVIVVLLAAVLIIRIKEEIDFRNALPDPEDALQMWVNILPDDTYAFRDYYGDTVVVAGKDTSYKTFVPSTGKEVTALVLMECDDDFLSSVNGWAENCSFQQIYVPAAASRESLNLLKETYSDATVETVMRGDRSLCGDQFVLFFYGSKSKGALVLKQGYDTYFIGNDENVKGLKNKELTVSFYPKENLLDSGLSVEYAVFREGEKIDSMELMENVYEYAVIPYNKYTYYSNGEGELYSDFSFSLTGRIGER